jgi:hypothetical protein
VPRVQRLPVPEHALHARYTRDAANYIDCYSTLIERKVSLAQFVETFYTTWLFKLERWILDWAVNKPSHDGEARWLAHGDVQSFAAWTVEDRAPDQLLMGDYLGATRSWLMVAPESDGVTRLFFGSVVTSRGRSYRWLLGFHKLYSRALLRAARRSLEA